jgi:hypothetical protein
MTETKNAPGAVEELTEAGVTNFYFNTIKDAKKEADRQVMIATVRKAAIDAVYGLLDPDYSVLFDYEGKLKYEGAEEIIASIVYALSRVELGAEP